MSSQPSRAAARQPPRPAPAEARGPFAGSPLPQPRLPRREELEAATVGFLRQGVARRADLRVVDLGDGPLVVKDFAGTHWLTRLVGRLEIGHESRAYRGLGAMPGIPRWIGRIDAHALAVEKIEGDLLVHHPERNEHGRRHLAALAVIIEQLEARGFAHLDLMGRRNVMLRATGEVVAIDFAASLWVRPGGLLHRLVRRALAWYYRGVFLKWKAILDPESLTPEDKTFFSFLRVSRALLVPRLSSEPTIRLRTSRRERESERGEREP